MPARVIFPVISPAEAAMAMPAQAAPVATIEFNFISVRFESTFDPETERRKLLVASASGKGFGGDSGKERLT